MIELFKLLVIFILQCVKDVDKVVSHQVEEVNVLAWVQEVSRIGDNLCVVFSYFSE